MQQISMLTLTMFEAMRSCSNPLTAQRTLSQVSMWSTRGAVAGGTPNTPRIVLTEPFEREERSHRPPHGLRVVWRHLTGALRAASQHGEVVVDHVRHVEEHAGGDVHEHEDLYQHGAAPAAALRLTTARQRSPTAR